MERNVVVARKVNVPMCGNRALVVVAVDTKGRMVCANKSNCAGELDKKDIL